MANTKSSIATWGVTKGPFTGIAATGSGIITSYDETTEMMVGSEQNEIGAIIGQHKYDEKTTITMTLIVADSVEMPTVGKKITLSGTDSASTAAYVTSATVTESNTDFRKLRVTLEKYTNCEDVYDVDEKSAVN